ncbi:hypothetical protein [Cellulomonas palmilytica]|uniref:hypothetical protein n=1 Tax=Cellulomonas palmilytica TaxID=2608402 RepID=UPI001F3DB513|nr:hypothetical protein [Cellulomonas palmilytica]UJP39386.1 hypothetical protein F1D97_13750 [Cellulomonas palmilytica]
MSDPLLDHLRATAHDTAPEPGPALDPALVLSRGRRRRRTRYTVGAVAGVAAFATALAVGAPLLDRADGTLDPASAPSATATVRSLETAEPTAPETAQAVPATPPEPVDLGYDTRAVVGPGADGYLGAPGGVKVWLRSTDRTDVFDLRLEFLNGHVFQSPIGHDEPLEDRSREYYHLSYRSADSPDDEEPQNALASPRVVVGHLGKGGGAAPRAAVITSPTTAAELPLFQVPGSDRWFYVIWEGENRVEGLGQRVVIRRADGSYEIGSCSSRHLEDTCEVEDHETWMEDLAREVLE